MEQIIDIDEDDYDESRAEPDFSEEGNLCSTCIPALCSLLLDADLVPLCALGVVDVAATDVQENEVLAHALANVDVTEKLQGWAVKRSNGFVNEYPR